MSAFTHALSSNNYGESKFIVSSSAANGTHITIQSAITAASSGDTVFIRASATPYTEDLTLKAGVNLCAFVGDGTLYKDSTTFNVKIIGKLTATFSGLCNISNICLQTNSDFLLVVSGANPTNIVFTNCFLNASNNTSVSLTSNGGAHLQFVNCFGNLATTGIAFFAATSGAISIFGGQFADQGLSTTASTFSNASLEITDATFNSVVSTTNSCTISFIRTTIGIADTTAISLTGTSNLACHACLVSSGTASAISVGAGCAAVVFASEIFSTNTNAITGAGSIDFSNLTFTSSSFLVNTTTQTFKYTDLGRYKATGQPSFSAYIGTTVTNVTGDGTTYQIIYNTENWDIGNNFSTSTGLFTAPVTGTYQFGGVIYIQSIGAAHTILNLVFTNGSYFEVSNPFLASVAGVYMVNFSKVMQLTSGTTIGVNILVNGSTKTIGLLQGANINEFTGRLVL